ncbi:Oidioi.mRNA.OKI2018_I69.PAR.g11249.t1.cds [Oikopleura dioica]|uniref:Oidioi.mRNA.OKI2018_I69.PAR.g11249.t1.cds n=1 Tax=Oikopleura dioica TaxID=34765 RepID=A0ABN7S262_OIKDI|nr:Oidioi.mRNA.OKI2018_I69.PAR.g11249.t1.cds [Oikopleura dioica]
MYRNGIGFGDNDAGVVAKIENNGQQSSYVEDPAVDTKGPQNFFITDAQGNVKQVFLDNTGPATTAPRVPILPDALLPIKAIPPTLQGRRKYKKANKTKAKKVSPRTKISLEKKVEITLYREANPQCKNKEIGRRFGITGSRVESIMRSVRFGKARVTLPEKLEIIQFWEKLTATNQNISRAKVSDAIGVSNAALDTIISQADVIKRVFDSTSKSRAWKSDRFGADHCAFDASEQLRFVTSFRELVETTKALPQFITASFLQDSDSQQKEKTEEEDNIDITRDPTWVPK